MNLAEHSSPDRPFDGGAFHPQLPTGRASGQVRLAFDGAHFESEQGRFMLPLDGLVLRLGGANDRLVFLTHPSQPQATIHTADHAILEHPVVKQTPALTAQRAQVRGQKRKTAALLVSVAGLLLAAMVSLVLARGWFVKQAADAVPIEWEVKAGDTLFDQLIAGKKAVKDAELLAQLRSITERLTTAIPDNRYALKFHIIEDPSLNAFAMPGGNVVLHSGLLLAADTPEEVAGVLAHEIAHVTRRHSIRNILSSAGLYVVLSAVIGDASGLIGVLADNSAFLLDRKFSRDFEREADEVGWDYLLRGGIEPKGMITFFKKMEQQEKELMEKTPLGGAAQALDVLSTHPATLDRIANLEAKWAKADRTDQYRTIALNYTAFKDSLRAQLHTPDPGQRPASK